jgi:hypothetical protein
LKEVPATANLRAPRQEAPTHALGDEDNEFPTQISLAHTLPRGPFEELADKPLEPVAAGELVSSSRPAEVPSAPPTRFPETSGPEEEPPFVSDVIAVPPELYAPDSGARAVPTEVPASSETQVPSEETESPLAELSRGLESELTEAPVSQETQGAESATQGVESELDATHGLDSAPSEAPLSEETHGAESATHGVESATHGVESELDATHGLESAQTDAPVADVTHGLESAPTDAPLSDVTHGLESALTDAPISEVTHQGLDPSLTESPISELTPTADGPPQAGESDTAAMAPRDVPWELEGPPVPELPPAVVEKRRPITRTQLPVDKLGPPVESSPPVESPSVEVSPPFAVEERSPPSEPAAQRFEEPPPPEPLPVPDEDPARVAAAARIRAIAAELEQWVLPREDRAFDLDLPAAEPAKTSKPE